ncbi:MAG TPA: cupin domain-containing protein, partial [Thermomicrobiales bacterium]|nr:cupin domain-containing protein [Thermomicrobiales bacterium]
MAQRHGDHPGAAQAGHDHGAGFWVQPEEARQADELAFQPAFYDIDKLPTLAPVAGIKMSVMVGGAMMANWVRIEPGAAVPTHAHEHEQIGLVLEGEILMTIGDETRALVPGHAYTIPGNLPHAAVAGPQGCLVLDIFSPP